MDISSGELKLIITKLLDEDSSKKFTSIVDICLFLWEIVDKIMEGVNDKNMSLQQKEDLAVLIANSVVNFLEEKGMITIELAENIIEQGKKVIIFCNFTDSLNQIVQHFGKSAVKVDGSMTKQDRQFSVDQFQENEKIKVFVGNIKAAGVGLTLTAAEAVIMNDLSFLPSDHAQAEDRAYRYGQKNNVLVYYPIFENTIEGIIYDILNNKKQVIATVMGDNLNSSDMAEEILKRINENRK
jgi:SNF2 family DNA or RNA helicase